MSVRRWWFVTSISPSIRSGWRLRLVAYIIQYGADGWYNTTPSPAYFRDVPRVVCVVCRSRLRSAVRCVTHWPGLLCVNMVHTFNYLMQLRCVQHSATDSYFAALAAGRFNTERRRSWLYWRTRSGPHRRQRIWVHTSSHVTTCGLYARPRRPLDWDFTVWKLTPTTSSSHTCPTILTYRTSFGPVLTIWL